ncbi:MAG: hypothetical protein PHI55_05645 [Burkholderiaceae bacterium]|nr:hypothetical protein [Burkholderiaceae bacterium]
MRIFEIASAEEQLALVRVIFDNTWKALEQQAEQEQRLYAQRQAPPKPKPHAAKRRKSNAGRAMPAFNPIPLPASPVSKAISTVPNPTNAPSSTSQPAVSSAAKAANVVSKTKNLGKANAVQHSDLDGDNRHS